MADEYEIISPEMLASTGLELRLPFDAGSLDREDLTVVLNWEVAINTSGYGMGYLIASKDNANNPQFPFLLYFWLPIVRRGLPVTPQIMVRVYQDFCRIIEATAPAISKQRGKDFIFLNPPASDYMVRELEAIVNSIRPSQVQ